MSQIDADGEKVSRLTKALRLNFGSQRLDYRRLVPNLRPSASSADSSINAPHFGQTFANPHLAL
jgi:hypothetical protein